MAKAKAESGEQVHPQQPLPFLRRHSVLPSTSGSVLPSTIGSIVVFPFVVMPHLKENLPLGAAIYKWVDRGLPLCCYASSQGESGTQPFVVMPHLKENLEPNLIPPQNIARKKRTHIYKVKKPKALQLPLSSLLVGG